MINPFCDLSLKVQKGEKIVANGGEQKKNGTTRKVNPTFYYIFKRKSSVLRNLNKIMFTSKLSAIYTSLHPNSVIHCYVKRKALVVVHHQPVNSKIISIICLIAQQLNILSESRNCKCQKYSDQQRIKVRKAIPLMTCLLRYIFS